MKSNSPGAPAPVSTFNSNKRAAARDLLDEASHVAQFVSGVTLIPKSDDGLVLSSEESVGLYFIMRDLINRIEKANALLGECKEDASHG